MSYLGMQVHSRTECLLQDGLLLLPADGCIPVHLASAVSLFLIGQLKEDTIQQVFQQGTLFWTKLHEWHSVVGGYRRGSFVWLCFSSVVGPAWSELNGFYPRGKTEKCRC